MGPRPGVGAPASAAPAALSTSRRALLTILRSHAQPVTLTVLSAAAGLHVNTVREHLAALADAGLVTRGRAAPDGRGRPASTYAAADPEPGLVSAEYAGLAAALASTIHRTSSTPSQDATLAGIEWGRELARSTPGPQPGSQPGSQSGSQSDDDGPRGRVVHLLTHLGFAPRPAADRSAVLLTRCPLLDTARAYPEVICGVHLGIVRGALGEYAADGVDAQPHGAELHPFSDPGACRLELARTDNDSR